MITNLILVFLLSGPLRCANPPRDNATAGVCTCAAAKIKNGWCALCKVGYVAGIRIGSEMLFDALDAHGHDVDPQRIQCRSCQTALDNDGYCEPCRMGFVRKQAYLSRLTYILARGETLDAGTSACATCKANAARYGWCDACKAGMLGNHRLRDPALFALGTKELDRLYEALATLDKCETCAVAKMCDGTCITCKISYKARETTK